MGMDIGHDPYNLTIPVGVKALLDTDAGELKLLESGVII